MKYNKNQIEFIQYLDVIAASCRQRSMIMKIWHQSGDLDYALKKGNLNEKQLELLRDKIKKLNL